MKAKHRNRKRPSFRPQPALPKTGTPKRNRWLWQALMVFVAIGMLVAAVWYIAGLRKDSRPSLSQTSGPEPPANRTPSANAPEARRAARAVNNDKAFIAKVNHGNELITQGKPEEAGTDESSAEGFIQDEI